MTPLEHVLVGGVKVASISRAELTRRIVDECASRRRTNGRPPLLLFDCNGHAISLAARDPDYRRALNVADVIHADGGFVVLASRFVSAAAIPDRSATTDLFHDVIEAGIGKGVRHYLLGATEEVNLACAERIKQLHPGSVIAGRHHGYFTPGKEASILAGIEAADPDILWIGLGKPQEQLFAVRNRDRLPGAWAITCGGCFNYVTGAYRRAPRWMQEHHLEWLFRAVTTPSLLWRYAISSPHAIWLAWSKGGQEQSRRS